EGVSSISTPLAVSSARIRSASLKSLDLRALSRAAMRPAIQRASSVSTVLVVGNTSSTAMARSSTPRAAAAPDAPASSAAFPSCTSSNSAAQARGALRSSSSAERNSVSNLAARSASRPSRFPFPVSRFGLRDLVFVMREDQVDAAGMNVERLGAATLPDLLERHRGALEVPSRPAPPERRVPRRADLLVRRLGLLPQREIARVVL